MIQQRSQVRLRVDMQSCRAKQMHRSQRPTQLPDLRCQTHSNDEFAIRDSVVRTDSPRFSPQNVRHNRADEFNVLKESKSSSSASCSCHCYLAVLPMGRAIPPQIRSRQRLYGGRISIGCLLARYRNQLYPTASTSHQSNQNTSCL